MEDNEDMKEELNKDAEILKKNHTNSEIKSQ
jgi:hypothetical protein